MFLLINALFNSADITKTSSGLATSVKAPAVGVLEMNWLLVARHLYYHASLLSAEGEKVNRVPQKGRKDLYVICKAVWPGAGLYSPLMHYPTKGQCNVHAQNDQN